MSREAVGVVSGIAVMVAGVMTVWSLATKAPDQIATATSDVPAVTTTPVAPQTVEIPLPDMPGVPPEVQRILYWRGYAQPVSYDDLVGVPPEVRRVLIEYQAPLMVPIDTSKKASP